MFEMVWILRCQFKWSARWWAPQTLRVNLKAKNRHKRIRPIRFIWSVLHRGLVTDSNLRTVVGLEVLYRIWICNLASTINLFSKWLLIGKLPVSSTTFYYEFFSLYTYTLAIFIIWTCVQGFFALLWSLN